MVANGPPYSFEQSLNLLKLGNKRRLAQIEKARQNPEHGKDYSEQRRKLSEGQTPFAIIVSCSDSRFPPEIIFHNREGDLFVVRTAGHVVENDAAGSIEYAVLHLKVPLIVVMGHEKCGAVTAAVNHSDEKGHIFNVLEHIYPAVNMVREAPDPLAAAIRMHVLNTVDYLRNLEPVCKGRYENGTLAIIGAICPIDSYRVEFLDSLDAVFEPMTD